MKKRKYLLIMGLSIAMISSSFGAGENKTVPGADMPFPMGIIRSVFTIVQTPLELPRAIVNGATISETPSAATYIGGSIGGLLASPFVMFGRCIIGTADCLSLGLLGNALYSETFAPMIWHSYWITPKKSNKTSSDDYTKATEFLNKKEYDQAIKLYRKGAENNHSPSLNDLGWCYQNGCGVKQDYAEALKWYKKAADLGNASAQNNIGWLYQNGYGVKKDYAEAVKWYRNAAEKGNSNAQDFLGDAYFHGNGVPKDLEQAAFWYYKAAIQGNKTAKESLEKLGEPYKSMKF